MIKESFYNLEKAQSEAEKIQKLVGLKGEEGDYETAEKLLEEAGEIEKILKDEIFTSENIKNGDVDFSLLKGVTKEDGIMHYEFELEKEFRKIISPESILSKYPTLKDEKNWDNHIIDTYDASGRARIRIKNNAPRLSLKVPLFSKDEGDAKVCVRIEFKPDKKEGEEALLKIRDLILEEKGTKTVEKYGHPLIAPNGIKIWVNKGLNEKTQETEFWVEVDAVEDLMPFPEIEILRSEKSKIKV